ncbi:hypothetical protein C8J57DRAFT_1364458 [Mycena rebaudengoi]|nr:hypothetical protein C8J57DRAFT_1364458 [Mycena rebaudengoi]
MFVGLDMRAMWARAVLAELIRVRILLLGVAAALISSPRFADCGIGVSGRWCWSHSFHLPFVPPLLPPSLPFLLPALPPHLHSSTLVVST